MKASHAASVRFRFKTQLLFVSKNSLSKEDSSTLSNRLKSYKTKRKSVSKLKLKKEF